jgi:hypothetical protein
MVAEAVGCERVSATVFPFAGKSTGNFDIFACAAAHKMTKTAAAQALL